MAQIDGTAEDDDLQGTNQDDEIRGFEGADRLRGGKGDDVLRGGAGRDVLIGGDGNDEIYADFDFIVGDGGEGGDGDVFEGGAGDDSMYLAKTAGDAINIADGGEGNDYIDGYGRIDARGGAGDDFLVSVAATGFADGGDGLDRISIELDQAGEGVTIDLRAYRAGADATIAGLTFRGYEGVSIRATDGDDTIVTGDSGAGRFYGGRFFLYGGNDTATGGAEEDRLLGGTGNDVLSGGGAADYLLGEDGNDRLDGGAGADILVGGRGADRLAGGNNDDRLYGDVGNDMIDGGAGYDEIYGGDGNDTLTSGADGAQVLGEAGDDTLIGAGLFEGGSGSDRFVFTGESRGSGPSLGTILDLTAEDAIDLRMIDADPSTVADDAFVLIGRDPFSGTAGELRFDRLRGNTVIEGDLDGDAIADFTILIGGFFRPREVDLDL